MSEDTDLREALRARILQDLQALHRKAGWIVGAGAALIVLGLVALAALATAGIAAVLLVGFAMLAGGLVEIVHGLAQRSGSRSVFWVLLGALYAACGILVLRNPVLAAGALTLMLGAGLAASGIVRIALALRIRQATEAWGWVAASGAATIMLGLVILLLWPASSLTALGMLLALDLLAAGLGWLMVGLALRRLTPGAGDA